MEDEKKQKEAEARQRREEERRKRQLKEKEEEQSTIERERQLHSKKKQEEESEKQKGRAEAERIRKQKEQEQHKKDRLAKMGAKQVMVNGAKNGAGPSSRVAKQAQSPKSKAAAIEDERDKAEQMLEKKLREKKEAAAAKAAEEDAAGPSFSYAGYDNLRGELKHVLITKVVRKLGIAIDGGANTKQKAVIIREISVSQSSYS